MHLLAQCGSSGKITGLWYNHASLSLNGLHDETRQAVSVNLHRLLQQLRVVVWHLTARQPTHAREEEVTGKLALMKPGSCGPKPFVVPGSQDMDTGTMVLPWKQPHADSTSVSCDGTPFTSVAHLRPILMAVSTAKGRHTAAAAATPRPRLRAPASAPVFMGSTAS